MSKKALILFGTRHGATTGTSEEIAKVLRGEGVDVRVVNAKEEKVNDISEYDLVIVGSGMQIDRWTGEAEKFLKKFQKELAAKKVALFVSSGIIETADIERAHRKYLAEKAAKYNIQPVALGLFGGIWDFNKAPWWAKKALEAARPKLTADGIRETSPDVFDTRDWEAIRAWAKELAAK